MTLLLPISSSKRVLFSVAFSVLAHALLLASLGASLQPRGNTAGNHTLAVRLLALPTIATISKNETPRKPVLTRTTSPYRLSGISQSAQTTEVTPPPLNKPADMPAIAPVAQIADTAPQGSPTGFGFPRAIGLPWAPNLQVRPVQRHEQPVAAYREMHEKETAAQRQLAMLSQISAALGLQLAGHAPEANGRCTVSQSAEMRSLQIACEPAALEDLLGAKHIALLNSLLTGIAGNAGAFGIVIVQNKVRIIPMSDNIHRSK